MEKMLPPLTLQLLLENAVKHNSVLASRPLRIEIASVKQNMLQISNNLQPKTSKVHSNKMGLHNIITKYKLLNQPEVTVLQTGESFCVTIPLIINSQYADPDRGR